MKRSDTDIRRDVEAELQWDPSIDDLKIGVFVCDGVVTLTGEVTHLTGRCAAEVITKQVNGVRGIANEIQITVASNVKVAGVNHRIEEALKCLELHEAQLIHVHVDDSTIDLSGQAHRWREQSYAAEAVSMTPGDMENRLEVRW